MKDFILVKWRLSPSLLDIYIQGYIEEQTLIVTIIW